LIDIALPKLGHNWPGAEVLQLVENSTTDPELNGLNSAAAWFRPKWQAVVDDSTTDLDPAAAKSQEKMADKKGSDLSGQQQEHR